MSDSRVIPFPTDDSDSVSLCGDDFHSGEPLELELKVDKYYVLDTWLRVKEFTIYAHKDGYAIDRVGKEPISFPVVGTIMMLTNEIPAVLDPTEGMWCRLCLVPFKQTFTAAENDSRFIENKLIPEIEGILQWCVEGARKYLENNELFCIAEQFQKATDSWAAEE